MHASTHTHICTHTRTHTSTAVTLTYTIPSRPVARRPIPEERVVYTCEVEGATLTWTNPLFQDLTFVYALHEMGDNFTDDAAGNLPLF